MPRKSISLFRRIGKALETIEPGDMLVLYSDGITEATGEADEEEYGRDRLLGVLRTGRHLDPLAIVDRVFSDVDDFSSISPPADDQTLVAVKRRAADLKEIPA